MHEFHITLGMLILTYGGFLYVITYNIPYSLLYTSSTRTFYMKVLSLFIAVAVPAASFEWFFFYCTHAVRLGGFHNFTEL